MRRLTTLTTSLLIIFLGYFYQAELLSWSQKGGIVSSLISIIFVAMLVFFPVIPFPLLAGVIGSVEGIVNGILISLVGIMAGTTIMFFLSRYGFQRWSQVVLERYPKASNYVGYFERKAFLGILFLRIVPVIPSPLVNILSSISKVNVFIFLAATLIGKIPGVMIFTIAGNSFWSNQSLSLMIYGGYFLFLLIIASIYFFIRKAGNRSGKEQVLL